MATDQHIAALRQDYSLASLDEDDTGLDPIAFFRKWFAEAQEADIDEVNAMTLATSSHDGRPHARIVLFKGLTESGFVFFTNYDSNKGQQITESPYAAVVFFWKELQRQVRIEGRVSKISDEDSTNYFHSRPKGSQIGALASPQSKVVESREWLESKFEDLAKKYNDSTVPKPACWGGYELLPERIEFWQGRSSRLHDRILFSSTNGKWLKKRLAP